MDAAWLLLLGLTAALFLLDREPGLGPWTTGVLLSIAAVKAALIGAAFMGLLRASRPVFFAMVAAFMAIAATLTFLMT